MPVCCCWRKSAFVKPDDRRFLGTLEAVERQLLHGGNLMRYDSPDDFGAPANSFIICTFWYVETLAALGRDEEARHIFENMLDERTNLGLLSEDIDIQTGELWGNFPQTYSQVGLINCAIRLSRGWETVPVSRLVAVSNRVVLAGEKATGRAVAGGLAVAIGAALRDTGGLWFGWSGNIAPKHPRAPHLESADGVTYATIDITAQDRDAYYNGFSNRTLWPLFHYRTDLTSYDRRFYQGYQIVNAVFARHLSRLLEPDDIVWVHDFHLIPLGEHLRGMGVRQPIGFFLHIPFPATPILMTLPDHASLIRSLFAYDLIGFQTESDLHAFHDYIRIQAGGQVRAGSFVSAYGKTMRTGVFPIGIDAEEFVAMAGLPGGAASICANPRLLTRPPPHPRRRPARLL